MKVQLTRDLALPLAKKGCTFGVELKTTYMSWKPKRAAAATTPRTKTSQRRTL